MDIYIYMYIYNIYYIYTYIERDFKAGNPNKYTNRKIIQSRIAMTPVQGTAHQTFFGFKLGIWFHIQIGKRNSHWLVETYQVTDSNRRTPKDESERWLLKSDDH